MTVKDHIGRLFLGATLGVLPGALTAFAQDAPVAAETEKAQHDKPVDDGKKTFSLKWGSVRLVPQITIDAT